MNPTRKDLQLSAQQAKIFDAHLWLIRRVWKRYAWCCPNSYLPDLLQQCRIRLCQAVQNQTPDRDGAHLWLAVRNAARDFLFTRHKFGAATLRDAHHLERSLDSIVHSHDDGDETLLDRIETRQADRDYQSECAQRADDRLSRSLAEAIKDLSPDERRIIRLRFQDGLSRPMIARRMGISVPTVGGITREAVRKLRLLLRNQGYRTLPENAPIPSSGGLPEGAIHWKHLPERVVSHPRL